MNRDEALTLADRILVLVNSKPQTPGREEIATLLEWAPECSDGQSMTRDEIVTAIQMRAVYTPELDAWLRSGSWTPERQAQLNEFDEPVNLVDGKPFSGFWCDKHQTNALTCPCGIDADGLPIGATKSAAQISDDAIANGHRFNIKTERGQTSVPTPERCPVAPIKAE